MAKATAAQEVQVSSWFMQDFWPNYPAWLCNGDKGSRAKTLVSMLKVNPSEEMQKRIIGNLVAQIRAAKQNPNRKYWSIGTTYVNNRMWEDEIESTMEVRDRQAAKQCSHEGCHNDAHGEKYKFCSTHIPCQHDPELRRAFKATGIDRKSKTLREDCMRYMKQAGYGSFVKSIGVDNAG